MSISNPVLVDYFDKIYIINLPSRQDRRDEMQIELESIGLSLSHPKIYLFPAVRPISYEGWPSLGAKGCFMSHYQVLQDAKAQGFSKILIIEDDLNFIKNFNDAMTSLVTQLDGVSWNIFYGGYELLDSDKKAFDALFAEVSNAKQLYRLVSPDLAIRTTHFVAFNQAAIHVLVNYLTLMLDRPPGDPAGGPMHVDGAYSWFRREHPAMKTLIAYPELGYQRSSATDIHDLKWFDRVPFVSCATAMMRKFKNFVSSR